MSATLERAARAGRAPLGTAELERPGNGAGLLGLAHERGPQVDRDALHGHGVRVLPAGRARGGGHAGPARAAREHRARPRRLQPVLHHARHDDDVPLRRAGDAGDGALPRAAHDRRAQRGVPQAQRVRLLDLSLRRAVPLRHVLPEHRSGCGLVQLRPAGRPRVLARQAGRRVGPDDHLHRDRRAGRRQSSSSSPSSSSGRRA